MGDRLVEQGGWLRQYAQLPEDLGSGHGGRRPLGHGDPEGLGEQERRYQGSHSICVCSFEEAPPRRHGEPGRTENNNEEDGLSFGERAERTRAETTRRRGLA